jgi:hypothetical protein
MAVRKLFTLSRKDTNTPFPSNTDIPEYDLWEDMQNTLIFEKSAKWSYWNSEDELSTFSELIFKNEEDAKRYQELGNNNPQAHAAEFEYYSKHNLEMKEEWDWNYNWPE